MQYEIRYKIYKLFKSAKEQPTKLEGKGYYIAIAKAENGKYGIVDEKGKIIIPFEYDNISRMVAGIFLLNKHGKVGAVYFEQGNKRKQDLEHLNGAIKLIELIKCEYDYISVLGYSAGLLLLNDTKQGQTIHIYFENTRRIIGPYDEYQMIEYRYLSLTKGNLSYLYSLRGEEIFQGEGHIKDIFEPRFHENNYIANRKEYYEVESAVVVYIWGKKTNKLVYVNGGIQKEIDVGEYVYTIPSLNNTGESENLVNGFVVLKNDRFELYNSDLSTICDGKIADFQFVSEYVWNKEACIMGTFAKLDLLGNLHETQYIGKEMFAEETLTSKTMLAIENMKYKQKYVQVVKNTTVEFLKNVVQFTVYEGSCILWREQFPFEVLKEFYGVTVGRIIADGGEYHFEITSKGELNIKLREESREIIEEFDALGFLIKKPDYSGCYIVSEEQW